MYFNDVISNRRSVRAYKNTPIPEDALDRIAESVRLAPSACNFQPCRFQVVFNEEIKARIHQCYDRDWLRQAPAVIIAKVNFDEAWKRLEGDSIAPVDMAIAMEHLVLAATAEGLGTCWICAYDIESMNKALDISSPWSVLAISPLGYPDETPPPKDGKLASELFSVVR